MTRHEAHHYARALTLVGVEAEAWLICGEWSILIAKGGVAVRHIHQVRAAHRLWHRKLREATARLQKSCDVVKKANEEGT